MTLQHRAFLFTDIVGSTAHWEANSPVMLDALSIHDDVVQAAIESANGAIFAHTGDGVAACFETATAATVAAAALVSRLDAQEWPNGRRIEVRVGLHAGEAHRVGDNWFGPTVNRAARVADAALPGQILATTAVVTSADASSGLGFGLKGIDEEIELVELAGPDGSVGPPRVRGRDRTELRLPQPVRRAIDQQTLPQTLPLGQHGNLDGVTYLSCIPHPTSAAPQNRYTDPSGWPPGQGSSGSTLWGPDIVSWLVSKAHTPDHLRDAVTSRYRSGAPPSPPPARDVRASAISAAQLLCRNGSLELVFRKIGNRDRWRFGDRVGVEPGARRARSARHAG